MRTITGLLTFVRRTVKWWQFFGKRTPAVAWSLRHVRIVSRDE